MSRLKTWLENFVSGMDMKKLLIASLPYILFGYLFNKLAWLYRMSMAEDVLGKLMEVMERFQEAFVYPFPSFQQTDILTGIVAGGFLRMAVAIRGSNAKKFRHGMEYGSARWGTPKDIEPYIDPVFENNIILTATERLMMSGRPKKPKYARNKNVIVIGGSGSGKTRFFVKPSAPSRAL